MATPPPLAWLAFAIVDGRFLAGLALWDVKYDVLRVSTRAGPLAAKVRRDDSRAVATLLLQALEAHAWMSS